MTTKPTLDDTLPLLFEQFGKTVDAELRGNDPNAQKDLPLNQHGEGESTGKKRGRRRTNGEGARAH